MIINILKALKSVIKRNKAKATLMCPTEEKAIIAFKSTRLIQIKLAKMAPRIPILISLIFKGDKIDKIGLNRTIP